MTEQQGAGLAQCRAETLRAYGVLDAPSESCFERIAEMAAEVFGVAAAAIAFADRDQCWFKAAAGLDPPERPAAAALCAQAIHSDDALVVPDACRDDRLAEHAQVTGPAGIRFYAGMPVRTVPGEQIGVLCVMDTRPHEVSERQLDLLEALARQVMVLLEVHLERARLREALAQRDAALAEAEAGRRDLAIAQRVAHLGSWVLNIPQNQLRWSEEIHRIFGIEPERFGGTFEAFHSLVHPDDRPALMAAQRRAERGEAPLDVEHRIVRPDGEIRLVHERAELVADADGSLTLLAGTVQDITDEREAARSLQEHQALIRMAAGVAGLGGWDVHLDDGRIVWSDEVCRIHGLPPGTTPTLEEGIRFYPEPYRTRIRALVEACAERGEPFAEELQIETVQGERRWVRAVGEPVHDECGRIVRMRGALQDIDARKRAEEQRHALARRLQSTLEQMSDAFVMVDPQWQIRFVNREAERVIGRTRSDLVGRLIWDAFPGTRGSIFEREHRRAVERDQAVEYEAYYAPLNLWVEVRAHPTSDGLAIYFRDIGRRRATQERLRLLEACVARMNDVVMVTEADPLDEPGPRIVFVNDAFERVTGYTPAEAVGRSPRFLQGKRTDRAALNLIRQALERDEAVRVELLNYTKAGAEFWAELDISPVADASGRTTHLVAVQRDITERKRSQARIEEQAAFLDQARDAIIVRGLDDEIRYWNRGAEALYGWRADEVLGRSVETVLYTDPEPFRAATAEVLASGEWSGALSQRHRDGGVLTVQCHWSLLRDDRGRPRAILAINSDITEKRQLEERLSAAQRLEAVGQLTGGIAHDFNNLLTVIQGNAEVLAEGPADSESQQASAQLIQQAAERGAELVHRLLAFARRQPLAPTRVVVNEVLAGLEALLRRTLPEHIEVHLQFAPELWPAYIDVVQFEACVVNLVLNARDAMPQGGRLDISTANVTLERISPQEDGDGLEPGDFVQVAVSDGGEGIPPELLPRVFEPFFTTKAVGKGTGMGLSMVYGFLRQSGGQVRIYSEVGVGTTVRLYLPRAGAVAPKTAESKPETVTERGVTARILVVEDDSLLRQFAVGVLRGCGHEVFEARDAEQALQILRHENSLDLLFTDVVMPGGRSGSDLAAAAEELRPGLKVLLTSGYTEDTAVRDGGLGPGRQFLQKPYGRRALARVVEQMLGDAARH